MRIGGSITEKYNSIEEWYEFVKELEYSTVLYPFDLKEYSNEKFKTFVNSKNLTVGEVGIWNNPLDNDQSKKEEAIKVAIEKLKLADEVAANCCVNIAGSKGEIWDGLYTENYSEETYIELVYTIQKIIDAVEPENTFFTLECMPWMVPDSPEQYLQLIKDVDRKAFGVHLDFVNMINSPKRYAFRNEFVSHCFNILGDYIKSVHLKDVKLVHGFPINLRECAPGKGSLDYVSILKHCSKLDSDISVFVEHMSSIDEYKDAIRYLRNLASENDIEIK